MTPLPKLPARAWRRCLLAAWLLALTLAPALAADIPAAQLPPEAQQTLRLIAAGGPFPYKRDGVVFGNYEKRLPLRPRGDYREYTVATPGAKNRGARRIVVSKSGERYYSADHYRTFQRILDAP